MGRNLFLAEVTVRGHRIRVEDGKTRSSSRCSLVDVVEPRQDWSNGDAAPALWGLWGWRLQVETRYARAVETIARSGGLVTGRAGGHRPTLPRPPHDSADSDLERCTMTYSGSLPSPSRHF
jgi:hypothetical protein